MLANVVATCWEVAQCRVDERIGCVPTSNLAACWQMVRLRVGECRSKMLADRRSNVLASVAAVVSSIVLPKATGYFHVLREGTSWKAFL